jgi:hypothetical protein
VSARAADGVARAGDRAADFQKAAKGRLILLPDLPSYDPLVAKDELVDHELHKYGSKIADHKIGSLPSEIFRRQVFTTYEDEGLGVEPIPRIGADNVMWASDYPHGDSTWPHSRKALAESPLARHGAEILRKVTCETAARVYGFETRPGRV